uniref:Reverse transcriptase/retrotransposon-derived protein RNase H-like domain-containing protein n=1 Tax=Tetradesmus obliquus TaxID=3088 RepID=A0A383WJN0_TETOB
MCALQPPTSVKRLQAHLGLFNYYRCYIPSFSRIAQPLYSLLRKGAAFIWGEEQQAAYDQLKAQLSKPGTALRQPDASLPFRLYTDWSSTGIAAVLNQVQPDGSETMVACSSRSLSPAEKNYAAWKGEMLAAVYGIRAFPQPSV